MRKYRKGLLILLFLIVLLGGFRFLTRPCYPKLKLYDTPPVTLPDCTEAYYKAFEILYTQEPRINRDVDRIYFVVQGIEPEIYNNLLQRMEMYCKEKGVVFITEQLNAKPDDSILNDDSTLVFSLENVKYYDEGVVFKIKKFRHSYLGLALDIQAEYEDETGWGISWYSAEKFDS